MKNILGANQDRANDIRTLLKEKKVLMVNLIGSPGSGKTTLLEKTIDHFKDIYKMAVIEGDVATDRDARRLQPFGIPIVLINTDGACHLESISIRNALDEFDIDATDIIFVENVGNLVCPAEFDIGEHAKVAISSVPEGDDKPEKYPLLFNECSAVVLNKTDLLEHTNFSMEQYEADVQKINGDAPLFKVSCSNDDGLDKWYEWVSSTRKSLE